MYLREETIERLASFITGSKGGTVGLDETVSEKSKWEILNLFQDYGLDIEWTAQKLHKQGTMPDNLSRKDYTKSRLSLLNENRMIKKFIEDYTELGNEKSNIIAQNYQFSIDYLKGLLQKDGYDLQKCLYNKHKVVELFQPGELGGSYFDLSIKENLLFELKKAEYLIWAAVAWITDEQILDVLKERAENGVNVQLIAIEDDECKMKTLKKYKDDFNIYG